MKRTYQKSCVFMLGLSLCTLLTACKIGDHNVFEFYTDNNGEKTFYACWQAQYAKPRQRNDVRRTVRFDLVKLCLVSRRMQTAKRCQKNHWNYLVMQRQTVLKIRKALLENLSKRGWVPPLTTPF